MSDPNETNPTGQPAQPATTDPVAPTDPVTEAKTEAAKAQEQATQALSDPQADLNQLLDAPRTVEVQLYGIEVVQQVQQLSDAEKQEFASARLLLTSVINQLNTAQLSDIADKLEQKSGELQTGIQSLEKSLNTLTGTSGWASAVNGIIGVIGRWCRCYKPTRPYSHEQRSVNTVAAKSRSTLISTRIWRGRTSRPQPDGTFWHCTGATRRRCYNHCLFLKLIIAHQDHALIHELRV